MIEIHGLSRCPFAFRARLAAREKGLTFDWIPFDAPQPDERAAEHNPGRRSPLLWHDGFTVTESSIITQYLDEAFDGPALQPADPRGRAQMRLTIVELSSFRVDGRKDLDAEARAVAEAGLSRLDGKLESADWLGGASPSLADIEIWPWMAVLEVKGMTPGGRAAGYWERLQARSSFMQENPYRR